MNAEERKARISELREQFKGYDADKYEDDGPLARSRGNKFEKLVREVFRAWGMLRRGSYHTGDNKSEQIDGVVEFAKRLSLLEVKWEKANLAASELFAFLGKVEGKFTGMIGIFVSRNPLTSNFLTALRAGRRQSIIVIHGRDVDAMFDKEFDLPGYLEAHVFHVCVSNLCHLSADKYLKKLKEKQVQAKVEQEEPNLDLIDTNIKEALKDREAGNVVDELAQGIPAAQRPAAVRRILENYSQLTVSTGQTSWRGENIEQFLKELVQRLPAQWTDGDVCFFMDKLSRDFAGPSFRSMAEFFAPRFHHIPPADKTRFEDRLKKQWDKAINEWVTENYLAIATEPFWDMLSEETKAHLIKHFVGFILSSRGAHHEQYQLAVKVLKKDESDGAIEAALRDQAKESAAFYLKFDEEDEDDKDKKTQSTKKAVVRAMAKIEPYYPDYKEVVEEAIDEVVNVHE